MQPTGSGGGQTAGVRDADGPHRSRTMGAWSHTLAMARGFSPGVEHRAWRAPTLEQRPVEGVVRPPREAQADKERVARVRVRAKAAGRRTRRRKRLLRVVGMGVGVLSCLCGIGDRFLCQGQG